ncbi:hypothetical protein GCM10012320_26210 [Sinomonas cellulolyticus]|nr:hypothetical protein GCM10012320_26210 [Sinomonas sp. KCTC 49339]
MRWAMVVTSWWPLGAGVCCADDGELVASGGTVGACGGTAVVWGPASAGSDTDGAVRGGVGREDTGVSWAGGSAERRHRKGFGAPAA